MTNKTAAEIAHKDHHYSKTATVLKDKPVYILEKTCKVSGEPYKLTVSAEKWDESRLFGLVKSNFPTLSAEEQKFIETGLTPAEQSAKKAKY